jgi:hypothetical protein
MKDKDKDDEKPAKKVKREEIPELEVTGLAKPRLWGLLLYLI